MQPSADGFHLYPYKLKQTQMEATLQKVWENIEAHLRNNKVIEKNQDRQERLLPIPPNSDSDIKEFVIAVLRGDKK